jgi:hypothetical protein
MSDRLRKLLIIEHEREKLGRFNWSKKLGGEPTVVLHARKSTSNRRKQETRQERPARKISKGKVRKGRVRT